MTPRSQLFEDTIQEAIEYSKKGDYKPNPNFGVPGHPDKDLPSIFIAHCKVHWRPDGIVGQGEWAEIERIR